MLLTISPAPCSHHFPPGSGVLSDDTSLSVFTVDGAPVTDSETVNRANGTTSVTVVATAAHAGATVGSITGDSGLATGDNDCFFTVTAEDGVTTHTYHVNLHVLDQGLAETTEVTAVNDVNGSLHATEIAIYKSDGSGGQVLSTIRFNNGGVYQTGTIDFTGTSGFTFATLATAYSLSIPHNEDGESSGVDHYWFNTGTETSPGGGSALVEVAIGPTDDDATVAAAFVAANPGTNYSMSAVGALVTVTQLTYGPKYGILVGDSGTTVTPILTPGRSPASAPSGGQVVNIADNSPAGNIAIGLAALDGTGWNVTASGDVATFVDQAVGSRTAAANGSPSPGFSFNITQHGRAAA